MKRRIRAPVSNALERNPSGASMKSVASYGKIPTSGGTAATAAAADPVAMASSSNSSKKTRPAPSADSTPAATAITGTGGAALAMDSSPAFASPPPAVGHSQSFLESIFLHLAEAREELEQLADSKHKTLTSSSGESPGVKPPAAAAVSWSSGSTGAGEGATVAGDAVVGDAEEEAIRVRLRRCLGLLQGVIRGASGVMSAAHAHRGMGLPGEVSVRVGPRGAGSAGLSSASSALSAAGEGVLPHPLPNKYLLEVHPLETVGSVRARLAAANGTCVDNTRMAANGKNIGTDGWTCEEAGIGHKAVLITIVTPNHHKFGGAEAQATRANEDAKRRRADPTRHEGDVIAMQDGLFDELFRLLECAHGLKVRRKSRLVGGGGCWDRCGLDSNPLSFSFIFLCDSMFFTGEPGDGGVARTLVGCLKRNPQAASSGGVRR